VATVQARKDHYGSGRGILGHALTLHRIYAHIHVVYATGAMTPENIRKRKTCQIETRPGASKSEDMEYQP
jgi:hypothetical protein